MVELLRLLADLDRVKVRHHYFNFFLKLKIDKKPFIFVDIKGFFMTLKNDGHNELVIVHLLVGFQYLAQNKHLQPSDHFRKTIHRTRTIAQTCFHVDLLTFHHPLQCQ